jgi:DNA-binding transcriptional LysR family regulator
MEIRELVSFYHVARLRSVSKAAEYLEIGQPTVTTHLQKIEREFGVTLFDRIKRPIQLTSDGQTFYGLAKPIVENISEGIETLKVQMEYPEHRGSFIIGAYPDLVLHHLAPIVKEFRANYPQVHIKLVARSYLSLMELVSAGDLDLALATEPESGYPSLEYIHLFASDFVLVTPLGHELLELPEVTFKDIARWPLIMLGPASHSRRTLEQALKKEGLQYDVSLEMDIVEMSKRYVEIGMGISVTHQYTIQPEDSAKLGIRNLSGILPPTQMGLITLRGKFLSRSIRNFIDTLVEHLGE